jgi:hypothetical protein
MGKERKVSKVLVGNPEGKRPLGRPSSRKEDEIMVCVDWIRLPRLGTGDELL